jgi:protein-tyrosine phosphatase
MDHFSEKYAIIFRSILSNQGCCIFNCTAGKDRTGIIAMLLLKLAGTSDALILADYAVSAGNLGGSSALQQQLSKLYGFELPEYIFASEPSQMEKTIRHLEDKYGDAAGYLRFCGLSDSEILALKKLIIE